MYQKRILCLLLALVCAASVAVPAQAAEVECDGVYCFSQEDFSGEEPLTGICITGLPDSSVGTIRLGARILQPGDILPADRLNELALYPLQTETDTVACLTYLPIYADRVESAAVMSVAVVGKTDLVPVAEDSTLETYRNLPNEGMLKAKDPEGKNLSFTVTRLPKRGEVTIRPDGSFVYTPAKNKTGVDSFSYTAADAAGNVSREATVTVTVLKPADAKPYTDTAGKKCAFAAEWMKNTGIFVGETVNGNGCFQPDKEVSRGEFLTMLVGALELEWDSTALVSGFAEEAPQWLKPYLAAALRSGLTAGLPEGDKFQADVPITGAEAAVMIHNALDLQPEAPAEDQAAPAWASYAMATLESYGVQLEADEILNRGRTAELLYQISGMKADAPGMTVLRRMQ